MKRASDEKDAVHAKGARGGAAPQEVEAAAAGTHPSPAATSCDGLSRLYASPEFLIRRAHQVASAAFAEACADLALTPSQYAALFALRQRHDIGQNELGRLIALDRSTTSLVVKALKERGLVQAHSDPCDRRKSFLALSDPGRLVLAQAEQRSAQAGQALLSVFDEAQRQEFLRMLRQLSEAASGQPPA